LGAQGELVLKPLAKFVICVLIVFMLIGAGDFLNLPLWPVDLLKLRVPVELTFRLMGCDLETSQKLIHQSRGIKAIVLSPAGKQIQLLHSDKDGIIRTVLQIGLYEVEASMVTIYEGEFYGFSTDQTTQDNSQPKFITIGKNNQNILTELYQIRTKSHNFLQQNLRAYLKTGELNAANIVARIIDQNTVNDIETIVEIRNKLDALPTSAYNSRIHHLSEMIYIIRKYCPETELKIKLPGETIFIDSRIAALRRSRNEVIRSHFKLINEFMESGRLKSVVEEWRLFVNNPELYLENASEQADISKQWLVLQKQIQDIESQLCFEIEHRFRESVESYNLGDLESARIGFTQLLADLKNLGLQLRFQNTEDDIHSYLDDIALIFSARQAIHDNQLSKALILLDTVLQPNELVYRRIEEAKQFMQMQSMKSEVIERKEEDFENHSGYF